MRSRVGVEILTSIAWETFSLNSYVFNLKTQPSKSKSSKSQKTDILTDKNPKEKLKI